MVPTPRITLAVNLRARDRFILDGLVAITQVDRCDLTSTARRALEHYVKYRKSTTGPDGTKKMDEFLSSSPNGDMLTTLLTPDILKSFSDSEIMSLAKVVRARRQELDGELRKRGFFIRW